ncbi:MAG TPA: asparagine synthase (glutamine-hydrolyzing) [Thermoanaerobaculia bacterium]|nr:asparagine synthase (glutamine-hydrolyzing) [Thermoanaerobaculia bacterium]
MCGFVGFMDLRGEGRTDAGLLRRMTDAILHRGPDSSGEYVDARVALGARRLSIIDLETGEQPIFNEDGSIVLVCNGEIFNHRELRARLEARGHRFATRTDIEVLVHLYEEEGPDLVHHLNGQFAFALYDRREERLLLARDHFGISPLHFAVVDGLLVFGSEIKGMLEHPRVPREVDLTGLDQILTFPGVVSPRTLFKGIESLPNGHLLIARGSDLRRVEYWDLDYPRIGETGDDRPESWYVEGLRERLTKSVEDRLQADVPVGFYLSGGIDSSLVAALIREVSPDVDRHSFSVTFGDRELCEGPYQRLMAGHVGSQHHEIHFADASIADRLTRMVYHCECPVKETYNTCALALSESVRGTGVKVVLAGQGADEIFAGYMGYRFDHLGLRSGDGYDLDSLLEDELREQLWGDPSIFYEKDFYAYRELRSALYAPEIAGRFEDIDCTAAPLVNPERLRGRHPVHQRSYLDFKLRLSEHLLSEHGDRMVMASSVEGRYPFLDLGVVDFARTMPPHLKLNDLTEKYVIKKVAADLVPRRIVEREKFGFRAPSSPYLLQQGVEWVHDLLSYDRIRRQGYFDPDVVERLKRQYSKKDFALNAHTETDFLMVVLTFGLFLDLFALPSLN